MKKMLQFYCMVSTVSIHCTLQHNKRCLEQDRSMKSVILDNFTQ